MEAQYTVYFEAKCLLKNIAFKQCAVVSTKQCQSEVQSGQLWQVLIWTVGLSLGGGW